MQKDVMMGFEKFNKTALEQVKKVSEINMKVFERIAEEQLAAAGDIFDGGVKQVELMGMTKDVQGAFKAQAEIATEVNEKLMAHAKKAAEILTEAKDEYAKLVEESMKVAADSPLMKPVAKAA